MDGRIGVNSVVGEGTEFWFEITLPVVARSASETPLTVALQDARILVVGGSAGLQACLCERLRALGARPETVQLQDAWLDRLREAARRDQPYRLVMIDQGLTGHTCGDFTGQIRTDHELAATPLIGLVPLQAKCRNERCQQDEFSGCLVKPLRHDDLLTQLQAALSGRQQGPAPIADGRESLQLPDCGHLRVLLAEDNMVNQRVALAILKKLGLAADAVANGFEALAALRSIPYDVVLMDCQMPEMDGYEATRRIRSGESGVPDPDVPVIAFTANALQRDREACLAAGMNDYLAKPVSPVKLRAMLQKWLVDARVEA